MFEIRFHGRGGQGTVLAAKMLADAVLRSGRGECLAIPEFGVERRLPGGWLFHFRLWPAVWRIPASHWCRR